MNFQYNDGGRTEAGYLGYSYDCVCRAIAIATNKPYSEVYDALNAIAVEHEHIGKHKRHISSARNGVYRQTWQTYLEQLGWKWTPTMSIGSGCKVHLRENELPMGRIIAAVSKHLVAIIDGTIHDTSDPSRNGSRCVYGYWRKLS